MCLKKLLLRVNAEFMEENTKALSKLQKKVLNDLQNGYILVTSHQLKGGIVCSKGDEYYITNRVFWNLVDKGIIVQQSQYPFHFVLTVKHNKDTGVT